MYKQIVHVNQTTRDTLSHNERHITLKCERGVFKSEWHHFLFEQTMSINGLRNPEGSLRTILRFHPYLVISCLQIQLGEVLSSSELMEEVIDPGHRISILYQ